MRALGDAGGVVGDDVPGTDFFLFPFVFIVFLLAARFSGAQ
jgi:hypothetical protein